MSAESETTRLRVFVGVTPGLEGMLVDELTELGLAGGLRQLEGGVEVRATPAELWRVAFEARVPEHLRVRVGRFTARHFNQLTRGLQKLPWAAYFPRGSQPLVKVTTRASRLYHSDAVAERARAAIAERLADGSLRSEPPASAVYIRVFDDEAEVSVDAAGERLHRRGYRVHIGKAPLRETLASACLRAAGWHADTVLWDPMCGSGTCVIEAASRAMRHPVPVHREFAFVDWPTHDSEGYARYVAGQEHLRALTEQRVVAYGSDVALAEIAAARANADSARLEGACHFEVGDFDEVEPSIPSGAMILTNLPYGRRVGDASLGGVYARFVAMLERRADLRPAYVLSGNPHFRRLAGGRWRRVLTFKNGGVPVELLHYDGPGSATRSGRSSSSGHNRVGPEEPADGPGGAKRCGRRPPRRRPRRR